MNGLTKKIKINKTMEVDAHLDLMTVLLLLLLPLDYKLSVRGKKGIAACGW